MRHAGDVGTRLMDRPMNDEARVVIAEAGFVVQDLAGGADLHKVRRKDLSNMSPIGLIR